MRTGLLAWGLAGVLATAAGAQTDGAAPVESTGNLRDVRYCELIVVKRRGASLAATVYNTLGLNDCPQDLWSALTEAQLRAVFKAPEVTKNGPRHWVLDGISADGATAAGATVEVGGIGLTARATLDLRLGDLRTKPYAPRKVDRSTEWRFAAGRPMFLLQGPDGARYAMQSYAQIVDPGLVYGDLQGLGDRLHLPAGWAYSVWIPATGQSYPSGGEAVIVQDELQNTYQKLP